MQRTASQLRFNCTLALFVMNFVASAADRVAISCALNDVQSAVTSASDGDRVLIPDGSCTWTSGISTTKQIVLRAQNYAPASGGNTTRSVIITNNFVTGNTYDALIAMTSGSIYHVQVSGIRFKEGTGSAGHLKFSGSGSKVPLVNDCYFEVRSRSWPEGWPIYWNALGGVIWNVRFQGIGTGGIAGVGAEGGSFHIMSPRDWYTTGTMGAADTNGNINVYMEDSTCENVGQFPDVDDHGRFVSRYNNLDGCWGTTHGFTSLWGGRHVEYYRNTFSVTFQARNHGRYFWMRAGTGIFTDNVVNDASYPSMYGHAQLLDTAVEGSLSTYPMKRQVGRGNDGSCPTCSPTATNSGDIPDPVYIWNNTGARASTWGTSASSYIQLNRDIYVDSGPKAGYSKFTYPHPFRSAVSPPSDTTAPSVPTSFSATATSSSQINLSWTASTDNVGVSGYTVEGCQGSSCTNFTQIATTTATSYSHTALLAATAYRYRVLAVDFAGNVSGYSTIATATTQAAAGDTTAPSVPSNVSASASSFSQINVAWTASTDNTGVTGYVLQRCQGSSCTSFSQIATPTGTSYSDTGLAASTTYRYRVSARDAAANVSGYSSIVTATTPGNQSGVPPALPEGETGIAALYPGDVNISAHPSVIFADNFESYTSAGQLTSKWNELYQQSYARIATETGNVFSGSKALEFRVPQQSAELANAAVKYVSPGEDTLFVRVYTKFDAGYNANGSNHNGIVISSNYSTPGVPANGTNKFYVNVENSRELTGDTISPGFTNVYTYQPDQRSQWGDHWYPDGRVIPFDQTPGDFGPNFVARPNFTPELNRWYCYELMVKANTPGQRDGRVAVWIDGKLIADFLNVRLRDVSTLKIDKFEIDLYIGSNTIRQNLKWYDNVVAARSYIGPMSTTAVDTPAPPTSLISSVQ